jgi:hypothetical protein
MKKSNKLLLGGFLTVILMIAGIHIALFAKYKNGNYTIYHPEDKRASEKMQSFPGVSYVIIRNVGAATVQFGDRAEVEKVGEDVVKYVHNGDSLIIIGQFGLGYSDSRGLIDLTLPYDVTLSAVNSSLFFEKSNKDSENNPVIHLQKSRVIFRKSAAPFKLGHVKVTASDSSSASFQGNTQVNNLEVQLSNSTLDYNEGNEGQLSIVTDSVSRFSIQYKDLLKAKITTTASNP